MLHLLKYAINPTSIVQQQTVGQAGKEKRTRGHEEVEEDSGAGDGVDLSAQGPDSMVSASTTFQAAIPCLQQSPHGRLCQTDKTVQEM
jgi:hypothetical protein